MGRAFLGGFLGKLAAAVFIAGCALIGFGPEVWVTILVGWFGPSVPLMAARIVFLILGASVVALWGWTLHRSKTAMILSTEGKERERSDFVSSDRVALLEFCKTAQAQHDWKIVHSTSLDGPDLLEGLRQAGLDQTILFWGRPNRNMSESLNRGEPLSRIPAEHWREYQFDWSSVIGAESNFRTMTYNRRQTGSITAGGYLDVHLSLQKALIWLQVEAPNFRGMHHLPKAERDTGLSFSDDSSRKLAGVVNALTERALSWSFKLPLQADDPFIVQYEELKNSIHPIWVDKELNQLRRDFFNRLGRWGARQEVSMSASEIKALRKELHDIGRSIMDKLCGVSQTHSTGARRLDDKSI